MKKSEYLTMLGFIFASLFISSGQITNALHSSSPAQKKQREHHLVVFKNRNLDLDTLKLIKSAPSRQAYKIWDAGKEPSIWDKNNDDENSSHPVSGPKGSLGRLKLADSSIIFYKPKGKEQNWQFKTPGVTQGKRLKFVSTNDTIYIAIYSPISSGSQLVCLNLITGKLIWKGEVKAMVVPHSKYKNEVFLKKIGSGLILAGDESGGILQVLDARTGKNLFCVHDPAYILH